MNPTSQFIRLSRLYIILHYLSLPYLPLVLLAVNSPLSFCQNKEWEVFSLILQTNLVPFLVRQMSFVMVKNTTLTKGLNLFTS